MNREQFFQELRSALHREGFTPQPEQDELLPVEWDGLPLCRITADGGVRYWQEDVATPERERACERGRNGNEPVSEPPIWPAPCGST